MLPRPALKKDIFFRRSKLTKNLSQYLLALEKTRRIKKLDKLGANAKTLEAKPFDQTPKNDSEKIEC